MTLIMVGHKLPDTGHILTELFQAGSKT